METLFGDTIEHPTDKPLGPARHRVLIAVKAAPNPSATHGETVCVAGVRLGDLGPAGWIRLYPINFRYLSSPTEKFKKYDIVRVDCQPAGKPAWSRGDRTCPPCTSRPTCHRGGDGGRSSMR